MALLVSASGVTHQSSQVSMYNKDSSPPAPLHAGSDWFFTEFVPRCHVIVVPSHSIVTREIAAWLNVGLLNHFEPWHRDCWVLNTFLSPEGTFPPNPITARQENWEPNMKHNEVQAYLEERNIRLARVVYAGPDGIIRGKAFRPHQLRQVFDAGIGLTKAQTSVTALDQLPRESAYQPVGEVRMRPDWSTLQSLPYLPGHARVLADLNTLDGQPWELCPRNALKDAVSEVGKRGLRIEVAFENEFTIYRKEDGQWLPIDDLNCFSSAAMDLASDIVLPTVDALEAQGVIVEKYFPEAGPGQQEIPVQHRTGVAAADQQVVFRETVRGVAYTKDYRASFMPKPAADAAGNGCHIHLSVWDEQTQRNLFYDRAGEFELSETGRQFIAGVLVHLPGLLALTAPTTNSYRRFAERCWSSCYVCWGPDNREATVRVASSFRGQEESTLNLEYKPADPTCNPYLALAGIIWAGLHGIDQQMDPGPPALTDPALMSAAERESAGYAAYPADLASSVTALENDVFLRERLGESRVTDYVTMKRAEIAAIESGGDSVESRAYMFRF